ncbi:xylulokinase [uncultured Tessaracoccus sp.]|uniref:xylulokinase n=1 Tax=uncultured Tessaracoccus sp. TaxID=905023 RepID=UPI002617013C|nr:xylulokinase [uncultured Tessaracoccus sp.]
MQRYIIAHDLGTSGNKATLFSTDGALVASRTVGYPTFYQGDNRVEQDANDWWTAVKDSTTELMAACQIDPAAVVAISFSGQMMGCLCVDAQGQPLRNSIIWADQRSEEQSAELGDAIPLEEFYRIVGHRNTPSYGIQKLMWIRDHEPETFERTHKVLNAKDYVIYKLTGAFVTDHSDANSMGCFDITSRQWSTRILDAAGIDVDLFPDAMPSTHVAGTVLPAVCDELGLHPATKVVVGAGDGVTANIGAGAVEHGQAYCCLGTSAWITATADQPVFDPEMRTVTWAHAIPGKYAPNGTMQYAGGSLAWSKQALCNAALLGHEPADGVYDRINELIEASPAGANGAIFLPYLLGERAPRWDVHSRGSLLGIEPNTSAGDIFRAVMEGVIFNLAIGFDILAADLPLTELTMVGGGSKSVPWQHIVADVLGITIRVPRLLEEAGSMGAAIIAGVGAGVFEDFSVIDRFIDIETTLGPDAGNADTYRRARERFDDFYHALRPVYAQHA